MRTRPFAPVRRSEVTASGDCRPGQAAGLELAAMALDVHPLSIEQRPAVVSAPGAGQKQIHAMGVRGRAAMAGLEPLANSVDNLHLVVEDCEPMFEHMDLNAGMAIVADTVDEVLAAAEPLITAAMPLDPSPAMAELQQERRYFATPRSTPIINTYAYASLQGYGAVDAVRAVGALLRAPTLPVWAPLVNARTGVDAAAQMYWLAEPGISVEARVQRGMAMRLHNARQQRRAPVEAAAAHAGARGAIADVRSQAAALGWTISGKDQAYARVGGEALPRTRDAIDRVLRHRQPERGTEADLTWWFYSGVMHANPFAFAQFISAKEAVPSGIPGLQSAPIYVNGRHFVAATGTLCRATINATFAYSTLLGRETMDLEKVERKLSETVVGAFQAMDRDPAEIPTLN